MNQIRYVVDFPRPPAIERAGAPVRVVLGGVIVADSTRAWRILETFHPPTYYLPMADFLAGALTPRPRTSFCEWKGVAHYLTLSAGGRTEADVAWTYPDPSTAYADLKDCVALYAGRMDACFVGDERVVPQPGGFYGGWITSKFGGPFKGGPGTQFW